jgi:hypothetical protein
MTAMVLAERVREARKRSTCPPARGRGAGAWSPSTAALRPFTVRVYGTRPLHGPRLVHKSSTYELQTTGQRPVTPATVKSGRNSGPTFSGVSVISITVG